MYLHILTDLGLLLHGSGGNCPANSMWLPDSVLYLLASNTFVRYPGPDHDPSGPWGSSDCGPLVHIFAILNLLANVNSSTFLRKKCTLAASVPPPQCIIPATRWQAVRNIFTPHNLLEIVSQHSPRPQSAGRGWHLGSWFWGKSFKMLPPDVRFKG